KDVWSKEAAKRAALDALAKLDAKGLDQLFERAPARPGNGGIEEILQNPNLTQEQKQQILEQLIQQQQQQQGKHGSLELHEQDVPVAWYADDDGSAKAGGTAAPAAGATTPAPAAPAAPAAGGKAPAAGG